MKQGFPAYSTQKYLKCAFLLIFVFSGTKAQKIWNLQDCIDYALENNIQVKREKLITLKEDNALQQTKWDRLPDLNAGYVHQYKTGFSLNDMLYSYDTVPKHIGYLGLESRIILFNGFSNRNEIKMHEFMLEKSLVNYHEFRNNIILMVASAYLEVLLNKEILEVAKNQLESTSLQVQKTKKLVDVGNIAKGELMKIQALEANDKLNVIQSQNNLDISLLILTQLLELKTAENFDIFIPELKNLGLFQIGEIEETYRLALENLPQIKSSELEVSIREKKLQVTEGKSYPEIAFRTNLNSWYLRSVNYDSIKVLDQVDKQKELIYSLDFSIPIFNKLQVYRQISNAKIDLLDAEYSLELEKKELYKKIQQAHADATAAYNKYSAAQEAVISNMEAFKYTEQKFTVGLVTSVDYNLSKNELLKAQSDLVISKYEFIFKVKILDFYSGKPFTL